MLTHAHSFISTFALSIFPNDSQIRICCRMVQGVTVLVGLLICTKINFRTNVRSRMPLSVFSNTPVEGVFLAFLDDSCRFNCSFNLTNLATIRKSASESVTTRQHFLLGLFNFEYTPTTPVSVYVLFIGKVNVTKKKVTIKLNDGKKIIFFD